MVLEKINSLPTERSRDVIKSRNIGTGRVLAARYKLLSRKPELRLSYIRGEVTLDHKTICIVFSIVRDRNLSLCHVQRGRDELLSLCPRLHPLNFLLPNT